MWVQTCVDRVAIVVHAMLWFFHHHLVVVGKTWGSIWKLLNCIFPTTFFGTPVLIECPYLCYCLVDCLSLCKCEWNWNWKWTSWASSRSVARDRFAAVIAAVIAAATPATFRLLCWCRTEFPLSSLEKWTFVESIESLKSQTATRRPSTARRLPEVRPRPRLRDRRPHCSVRTYLGPVRRHLPRVTRSNVYKGHLAR